MNALDGSAGVENLGQLDIEGRVEVVRTAVPYSPVVFSSTNTWTHRPS